MIRVLRFGRPEEKETNRQDAKNAKTSQEQMSLN